ncbi:MAG: helix-hairpin-helix domain-containing protein [Prevotellaceae bacterium]|nr:helix-hairpin-helix domain-containing protein [Prevotellaceae bacterium]
MLIIIFLLLPIVCFSQENSEQTIDRIIEKIFDFISDETENPPDFEQLYDDLTQFYAQKINLNQTDKNTLEKLRFLSDIQIENLLAYLYLNNGMKTIYELQLVEGFDWFSIEFLLPFTSVESVDNQNDKWNLKQILRKSKHEIVLRTDGGFEKKKGFFNNTQNPENQYIGSPFYELVRYNFKASDKIQAGFSAEKDAGEQFWGKKHKGFDSYNAYIQVDRLWKFERIVVGDFRATFGQGLIMNGAFSAGKSSLVLQIMPQNSGLSKKSGTDEFNFFRGVGATAKLGSFSFTAFYSFRKMNADTTGGSFTTLKTDGLFRQNSDFLKRHAVEQQTVAGNLIYKHKYFKIGATYYQSWLSVPQIPANEPYKLFAFSGKTQAGASVDYYFKVKKFTFFGETALNQNLGVATLNGVMTAPVSTLNLAVLQRYFSPKYDLFFANAFAKNSTTNNENGIYFGAEIRPVKRWKIAAYGDVFKFSWLKYDVSRPSNGFDALLQTDFAVNRNFEMYLRGKISNAEKNFTEILQPTRQIGEVKKATIRYNTNCKIGNFSFRSLLETSFAKEPNASLSTGFALMQDMIFSTEKKNISVSLHYVFFDAENYNNRFYFAERDVPYSMATPALYGKGNRYCLNFRMDIVKNLALYLRFAQTIYADNRTQIGTGLETIEGNVKSDFKVLVRWKF